MLPPCFLQDARRHFPHESLPVRFPFSGDDEVGILNLFCKVQSFQKKLYAGFQLCIQKCVETAPHTACRTSTGMQGYVFAGSAEYDVRKMLHGNIQFFHHIRVCSFWGANTWAAPLGPKKGLRTSHAAVKHVFFSAGWAEELSMELIADRRAPHRAMPFFMLPTSCPSLSKKRNPNACSIPRPASFVALPPSPMTKRRHPRSRASRISSPVPKVVVSSDSFCRQEPEAVR